MMMIILLVSDDNDDDDDDDDIVYAQVSDATGEKSPVSLSLACFEIIPLQLR